jgi:hypothetical protein
LALPNLRITNSQANEFRAISQLSPATFEQVLAALEREKEKRKFLTRGELKALLTQVVGHEVAEALTLHVIGLGTLMRRHEATVGQLMDSLSRGLKLQLSPDEFSIWEGTVKYVGKIFDSDVILTTIKAADLSYEYSNLLERAAVITDIRPVFSSERDELVGGIVAHILRITYFTESGEKSLSVALDEKDLRRLRAECDRALDKAARTVKFLENKGGIRGIGVASELEDRGV